MEKIDRRDFIKTTGLASLGAVLPGGAWGLNTLEPDGDPLRDFSYRGWEDLDRGEWTWDKIGHAAHCVNCIANYAWNVYVKDGIVVREEQVASYPQANAERFRQCRYGIPINCFHNALPAVELVQAA